MNITSAEFQKEEENLIAAVRGLTSSNHEFPSVEMTVKRAKELTGPVVIPSLAILKAYHVGLEEALEMLIDNQPSDEETYRAEYRDAVSIARETTKIAISF
jgi:hypothetical protein